MNANAVVQALMTWEAHKVGKLNCPQCGKGIKVAYTPGVKKSLGAVCASCLWGIQVDGLDNEPPWVRELGDEFQTSP
jgi:hypothetical protein